MLRIRMFSSLKNLYTQMLYKQNFLKPITLYIYKNNTTSLYKNKHKKTSEKVNKTTFENANKTYHVFFAFLESFC